MSPSDTLVFFRTGGITSPSLVHRNGCKSSLDRRDEDELVTFSTRSSPIRRDGVPLVLFPPPTRSGNIASRLVLPAD